MAGSRCRSSAARRPATSTSRRGATPAQADVDAYDFGEYRALYGRDPEPSYVLRARSAIAGGTTVALDGTDPTLGPFTVTVPVAARR